MYLIDTNIWLERLLDQERTEEVGRFLSGISSEFLFLTDFTLHSIGIALVRLGREEALLNFVQDAFIEGSVKIVSVTPDHIEKVVNAVKNYKLDFDDAYQYVSAEIYGLTIISFDADFI